ncbi:hypothetical protein MRB53_006140 [Persea americana]|uniref:Uncharacterized protein n=1 Tax=Persea americana TaxID=3435 RepID=A0ACC2MFB2_PERAE|nr:hypothetical protein MRB53_006140 [Persea americana]
MQQEVRHPFSGLLFVLRVNPDQCVVAHAGFVGALIPKERIKLDPQWATPCGRTTETEILGREQPGASSQHRRSSLESTASLKPIVLAQASSLFSPSFSPSLQAASPLVSSIRSFTEPSVE